MRFKLAAFADEADSSLSGQISALTENSIKFLEIRGVDGENISDISPTKAKEIRKKLDESGISVWSLGSPFGKIGICDDFEVHLEKFKKGLETADILNAKRIRLFSFYVPADESERYRDEVLCRLEQFLIAAKGSDVTLCHENEKGIYGDTAARCKEIHSTFPKIKAVFDPANFIQNGQNAAEAWDILSPYVEYMHIKDATENGTIVPAGEGSGNIPFLLEQYKGEVLTLEPHLAVFEGFDKLEGEEKTKMGHCYSSPRVAFDTAVIALKKFI